MQSFVKNLKRLREESGMTQEQLAESINVTRQAVSCWERGRTEPDIATIIALSKVLNVDAEELIFGRKTKRYDRFQKKYLVCAITSLSLVLIVLLLHLTLDSYLETQINMSYIGKEFHFFIFTFLFPYLGNVSLGVFAVSFVALFYKVCLCGRWRRAAFFLGLAAAFPSLVVILDSLLAMVIPTYKAPFTYTIFVSTIPSQPIQMLLFDLLPILSGVLLLLSFDKASVSSVLSDD